MCKKTGSKAAWKECPRAATEAKMEEVIQNENKILKRKIENVQKVMENKIEGVTEMQDVMENQLRKILEKIYQDCGIQY